MNRLQPTAIKVSEGFDFRADRAIERPRCAAAGENGGGGNSGWPYYMTPEQLQRVRVALQMLRERGR